jgi:uncharacterized protein involved in outer membrane biogenesis
MRKAFLFSGLALTTLIVVVLASVTYVLFDIDTLIKETVESSASRAFKVPATVAGATMSLKSGDGQIVGLIIANPPGFTAPEAMHIPLIDIQVDTGRIAARAIALHKVVIEGPHIVLEVKDGRVNLMRLKESTQAWVNRAKSGDPDAVSGQQLLIDEVVMLNGRMTFRADFLDGGETEVPMPDSRVTNIGKEMHGALPAEVIDTVMKMMITAAERASRRIDLKALAEKSNATAPDIDLGQLLKVE